MADITRELLRKRAEHNEGMLSNLEEVSLHQQNLKAISGLDIYCRHLKQLLMQNNLIEKMEGLSKLKELEYINLAVNSIEKIEGIKRCESLEKLDLTLNLVDIEHLRESMEECEWCDNLREIFLTGNPCTDWEHCKAYVIAKLPQLQRLDGDEIERSQRLEAKQRLAALEAELEEISKNNIAKKEYDRKEGIMPKGYSKEQRWADYLEEKERKEKDEKEKKENSMFKEYNEMVAETKNRPPPSIYNDKGEVRQTNQGGYKFTITESADNTKLLFELQVPKFMDTSSLNIDLQPQYCRCDIKGKITQVRFPEEILVEQSQVQRSQTTGYLLITAPKADIDEIEQRQKRYALLREENEKREKLKKLE